MPPDGWLKINGQNYTPGMAVPFVADWEYDSSKFILNESKCMAMSKDERLLLFIESATYGSSGSISIFNDTKNASYQGFRTSSPEFSFAGYKGLEPLADFVS